MIVRSAVSADLDQVMELIQATPELPQWSREALAIMQPKSEAAALLAAGQRRCLLIAEEGNVVLGFIQFAAVLDTSEVESIAVAASALRQGVGSALLHQAIQVARRDGVSRMLLEVRAGNEAALRLYRSAGFVSVGRRPNYYSRPVEDAELLELSLALTV